MKLPVMPPVSPMLAKLSPSLPSGDGWIFEPKWDGFRSVVFRDGDEVELGSRNEKPLTRYFPELATSLKLALPPRCVLDGEIIIAGRSGLDFDALQQRIHPAASRVNMLAVSTPASFVAFDCLALGDDDLRKEPFVKRREALLDALGEAKDKAVMVTPATENHAVASEWFDGFEGAGLDGIVAKHGDLTYREGERAMIKVKHRRTADCVVAGYREHKSGEIVGSLLLGLYGEGGELHHVGVTSSFTMARRRELLDELAPYVVGKSESTGPVNGGPASRWNATKDLSFIELRSELVCEVAYDHMQGYRFRHTATFLRWRPDRDASSCTYEQLETPTKFDLSALLADT